MKSKIAHLREEILNYFSVVFGDPLLAEYFLLHLSSRVYNRSGILPLGNMPLNITHLTEPVSPQKKNQTFENDKGKTNKQTNEKKKKTRQRKNGRKMTTKKDKRSQIKKPKRTKKKTQRQKRKQKERKEKKRR